MPHQTPVEPDSLGRWSALLHPVRSAIWESLVHEGPATSSTLAARTGQSSGLMSYHLRYLARHDLVHEDTGRGTRRERWWSAVPATLRVDSTEPHGTVDDRVELARALVVNEARRQVDYWSGAWRSEDPADIAWRSASTSDHVVLELSLEQMRELDGEIARLIRRWGQRSSSHGETRRVQLVVRTYPLSTEGPSA